MIYYIVAFGWFVIIAASTHFRVPIFSLQQWDKSFMNSTEGYYVELDIGMPPQKLNVLIDTGSSNLAVLASNTSLHTTTYFQYNKSHTFKTERKYISLRYTLGSWEAFLATENISVPTVPHPLKANANLACIERSENFFTELSKWQGILGMAYSTIAKPTSLTPFFDSLMQSKQIDNVFSISMCGPFTTVTEGKSEMILGGVEKELYQGKILYSPIYREWYYEVVLVDIVVGEKHWPKDCSQLNINHTIVDTGTSDVLFSSTVYSWVIQMIKDHMEGIILSEDFWERKRELCSPNENILDWNFPIVRLSLTQHEKKKITLLFTPQMYLRRSIKRKMFCYSLAFGTSSRGTILGTSLLKGYYVVFDRQNKQIGFANLTCLSAFSDLIAAVEGPEISKKEMKDCVYISNGKNMDTGMKIVAYVVASLCLICAIPMLVMLMHWIWSHLIKRRRDCSESNSLIEEN